MKKKKHVHIEIHDTMLRVEHYTLIQNALPRGNEPADIFQFRQFSV